VPPARQADLPLADPTAGLSVNTLLLAILAVLVDERRERAAEGGKRPSPEMLLSDCGLPSAAIAQLLGVHPGSVRKALSRERGKRDIAGASNSGREAGGV
jgi:hypothetical protein